MLLTDVAMTVAESSSAIPSIGPVRVEFRWHVALAYVVSFFVMLGIVGWHPHAPHKKVMDAETPALLITPGESPKK
jgi:hypothetical protein